MEHDLIRLTNSVVARVAPTLDRGASMLLAGGALSSRRAAMDGVTCALRARAEGPLVVRVGAPSSTAQRLPEVLSDAVETALVARRAPGGLYEEHGDEVLRSLGPWLFRARAVGAYGLVMAIDELDAWLDARGRGENLTPWFGALLGECSRRALGVVASARAADASGAPSMPQDLVARFGGCESLGAPGAVLARDPTTLVAALAGRTFSRASLRAAMDAWLDLPTGDDADDALIVFSSPLAPPSVPSVAAPAASWVPPRPATSLPPRAPSDRPATAEELARWGETLSASVELGASLRAARSVAAHDRDSAEAAFRAVYLPIPRRAERVAAGVVPLGAERPRLIEAARVSLARFDQLVHGLAAELGADEPSLDALHELCAAHAQSSAARTRATLSLTGLRADLGEGFVRDVVEQIPGARVAAQGLRWVPPSTPERARALADVIARTPWEDSLHPQREHVGAREIYRVAAYAKALATAGRSLDEVAAQVDAALLASLRAWIGGLAGPLALLVVSDAGAGPADARGERRLGDGTAFAQILPWWIVTVGAGP